MQVSPRKRKRKFLQIFDAFLVFAIFTLFFWWRGKDVFLPPFSQESLVFYFFLLFHALAIPFLLRIFGFYNLWHKSFFKIFLFLIGVFIFVSATISLGFSFLKIWLPSRLAYIASLCFSLLLIYLRAILFGRHRKTKALLIGEKEAIDMFLRDSSDFLEENEENHLYFSSSYLEKLELLLREKPIEKVFFIIHSEGVDFKKAILICESCGVNMCIINTFSKYHIGSVVGGFVGNYPSLYLNMTPDFKNAHFYKNIFDSILAFFLIICSFPFWIFASIGILIASGRPVLFSQERVGKYGEKFSVYKFRTMIIGAEKKLEKVKKEFGNEMGGPFFKLQNDPRVFSFGKFLRKFSIDELPQLINVLKGEMSLVGPRPMTSEEFGTFKNVDYFRRFSVKPGITGLWQVSGRNYISSPQKIYALDAKYIDDWSFWGDIKILWRTLGVVIFSKGVK